MIVNISGHNSPFKFERITLKQFRRYKIRLLTLNANFTTKANAGIYKLTTNIIERGDGNSERILAYIRLNRKQISLDFTPSQVVWYKLRVNDFSTTDIKLQSIESNESLFFTDFAAQFEILRDERI